MRIAQFLILIVFICSSWMLFILNPPGAVGPYYNGVFPDKAPGYSGSWTLSDYDLDQVIASPLRILDFPGSNDLLVLTKEGVVWRVNPEDRSTHLLLDIRDRSFRLGDAGAVGIALHPHFGNTMYPEDQEVYIYYRYKGGSITQWDEIGFNRLSRFKWDVSTEKFDEDSEEILINQFDNSVWHNGGAIYFDSDGYLMISIGDEGPEDRQNVSTQTLSRGLFSGVLRIDVDEDLSRSHPIRRQPISNSTPPDGWGTTFTKGYTIPNDNPWLAEDGSILEEFYAVGIRSPYWMGYDSVSQKLWLTDVGSDSREEINIIEKGKNYQWPYKEGSLSRDAFDKPNPLIGEDTPPYFEYDRSTVGSCIIGGGIYHGDIFPSLRDQLLIADFTSNVLVSMTTPEDGSKPIVNFLISDLGVQPVTLPTDAKFTGIHPLSNGEVLVTIMGLEPDEPAKILKLEQNTLVPDPPDKLSELGVFKDMSTLEVNPGILPYDVNSPLWSDGALKRRWIAIPNDGDINSVDEQIQFSREGDWQFPEGTVLIKHFELDTDLSDEEAITRLETRFFVMTGDGGGYGVTYRWNDEGTEAYLLDSRDVRQIDIMDDDSYVYTQTWEFPSRDQCIKCHNNGAGYVLGVRTHQMNRPVYYPHLDMEVNQIEYLDQAGFFTERVSSPGGLIKSYAIDDESAPLETKIRSYLDANCSSCHRRNVIPTVNLDFRYNNSSNIKNYINFPTQSHASDPFRPIIKAGDHAESELWVRDASEDENRMPPLGTNIVNQSYVDSLAVWIDGLNEADLGTHDLQVFPNPSPGWLGVRINNGWTPPFNVKIMSMSGHLLLNKTIETEFDYFDLNDYPAGNYVLVLKNGDRIRSSKFVLY